MQAADHFRIADFGNVRASSMYFDQQPGLRCTCYDGSGPGGSCPFHPFGKRLHLSHNSQRSCEEVVLAYGNAWDGPDEELINCIMTQAVLAMMVGIFDYTTDHYVQLSQAYDGFDVKPLLHHLVDEHFRRNIRFGNRLWSTGQKKSDNFDRLEMCTVTIDEMVSLLKTMNTVDVQGVGVSCHFDKDDIDFLTKVSEMFNQILDIDRIGLSYVQVESHEGDYEEHRL